MGDVAEPGAGPRGCQQYERRQKRGPQAEVNEVEQVPVAVPAVRQRAEQKSCAVRAGSDNDHKSRLRPVECGVRRNGDGCCDHHGDRCARDPRDTEQVWVDEGDEERVEAGQVEGRLVVQIDGVEGQREPVDEDGSPPSGVVVATTLM